MVSPWWGGLPLAVLAFLLPPALSASPPASPERSNDLPLTSDEASSRKDSAFSSSQLPASSLVRREVQPHDHDRDREQEHEQDEEDGEALLEDLSLTWSPRRRVTSANVVNLDGIWSSSDGAERDVKGNTVTGAGDFSVTVAIKQGGRRLEMTKEGKNFWASLAGRGSLNWNDGEVWTRKVDCKFSDWTDFGACGGPCAGSEQQRQREYMYLQENGGEPCVGPILQCQESVYCGAAIQALNTSVSDALGVSDSSASGSSSGASGSSSGASGSSSGSSSGGGHGEDAHGGDAHGSHAHLQTSSAEGEYVEERSSYSSRSDPAPAPAPAPASNDTNATKSAAPRSATASAVFAALLLAFSSSLFAVSALRGAAA